MATEVTNELCPHCWTYKAPGVEHECLAPKFLQDKPSYPQVEIADGQIPEPSHVSEATFVATPISPPQGDFLDQLIKRAEDALRVQTGGSHYQRGTIQPIEFFHDSSIPFAEASVMKYAYRWRDKGGVQDLKKAIQVLLQIIAMEERRAVRVAAK